jgi:hypothetical protein
LHDLEVKYEQKLVVERNDVPETVDGLWKKVSFLEEQLNSEIRTHT